MALSVQRTDELSIFHVHACALFVKPLIDLIYITYIIDYFSNTKRENVKQIN